MMRAAMAALLLIPPSPSSLHSQADPALVARVDSALSRWNRPGSPGCAVGVDRAGAPLVRRAVGLMNLETRTPWTVSTLSESGSVAKQFTAAALVLLARDGKLGLDEDIGRWIPEVRGLGTRITARHLLSHTSGIPDRYTLHEIEGRPAGEVDHTGAEVMDVVRRVRELNFDPGDDYLYSNTAYVVAVTLLERISGKTLQQFTDERIFRPLGMTSTRWREDHRVVVPGRASAYAGTDSTGFRNDHPFTRVFGSGGLLTTVEDFLKWQAALDGGGPVWGAVRDSLERPSRLNDGTVLRYGLGRTVTAWRGLREVSHTGSTGGYRAALYHYPSARTTVALLCNLGSIDPAALARRLAGAVLPGVNRPVTPAAVADDSVMPAGLAGAYHAPRTEQVLVLVLRNGRLIDSLSNTAIRSMAPGRLRLSAAQVLEVLPSVPGAPRRLRVVADGARPVDYVEVDRPELDRAALGAYAGRYRSVDLGAEHRLVIERDTLRVAGGWRPSQALTPLYRDGFLLPDRSIVRFLRGDGGVITGFVRWAGRVRHLRFERIAESNPAGSSVP